MRMWERGSRVFLPVLLLGTLMFLYNQGIHSTRQEGQPITVVMSKSELRAMMAAKEGGATYNPPLVTRTSANSRHQTLHTVNNSVYHKDPPVKVTKVKSTRDDELWPPVLEHSDAQALLELLQNGSYDSAERQFLEERLTVMVARARLVRRACPPSSTFSRLNVHLVWDRTHTPSIVWCPNYKVASTTWMINFLKLAHFNDDNPAIPDLPPDQKEKLKFSVKYGARHGVVNDLYPIPATNSEKNQVMKQSVRVIIVRHPFTRILSAYRDKMVKEHPMPPKFGFKKLQRKIIHRYRPHNSSESSPFPTFSEFVQYVIDFTSNFTEAAQWKTNVRCWTPFWVQCGVCFSDYNIIMKLETMADDERFLITLADLKELKKSGSEWRHLSNISSHQAAPQFYSQLTRRQMTDLYQRYKLDFDLFDYSIDDYLSIAKDSLRES
ncbi:carbohydrate sulfotransferase 11-like [Panulirus ornatus]|uniref:carbohydrate sulfotransferase 11-like n=1 Tax=Panulirus ornatus TaxID=150431 RepID=UPI003A8526A9